MGVVSSAVLEAGGKVTGIVPYAMVAAGGEGDKTASSAADVVLEADSTQVSPVIIPIFEHLNDCRLERIRKFWFQFLAYP